MTDATTPTSWADFAPRSNDPGGTELSIPPIFLDSSSVHTPFFLSNTPNSISTVAPFVNTLQMSQFEQQNSASAIGSSASSHYASYGGTETERHRNRTRNSPYERERHGWKHRPVGGGEEGSFRSRGHGARYPNYEVNVEGSTSSSTKPNARPPRPSPNNANNHASTHKDQSIIPTNKRLSQNTSNAIEHPRPAIDRSHPANYATTIYEAETQHNHHSHHQPARSKPIHPAKMTKSAHAEDLQPNEGLTGVKTTAAHHNEVPKVLSTGNRHGRGLWPSPKRGRGWARRGGQLRTGGPPLNSHTKSLATPILPPMPHHHLPPDALNKALNSSNLVSQKRKLVGASSGPVASSSEPRARGSGPVLGRVFTHLLPITKRQKIQEQNQDAQMPVLSKNEIGTGNNNSEQMDELPSKNHDASVDEPDQMPKVHYISGSRIESVANERQPSPSPPLPRTFPTPPVSPPSTIAPMENSGSSSTLINSAVDAVTTTTTAIKDEPLDLDIPYSDTPDFSKDSGTKRYYPVPPSCHKFYSINTNADLPSQRTSSERLFPNPHVQTARAEYSRRAVEELRVNGVVAKRILWREDGMCVDWEKAQSVPDRNASSTRASRGPHRKPDIARNDSLAGLSMDGLFTMEDKEQEYAPIVAPRKLRSRSPPKIISHTIDLNVIDLTSEKLERKEFHDSPQLLKDSSSSYNPPLVVRLGSGRTHTPSSTTPPNNRPSARGHSSSINHASIAPRFRAFASGFDQEYARTNTHQTKLPVQAREQLASLRHRTPPVVHAEQTPDEKQAVEHRSDFFTEYEVDGIPVIDVNISPLNEGAESTDEEMQVRGELGLPNGSDPDPSLDSELSQLEYPLGSDNLDKTNKRIISYGIDTKEDVDPQLLASLDPTRHLVEAESSSGHEKAEMEQLAIDFLHRYIRAWEYDRAALARAYTSNAVFTCSVSLSPSSSLSAAVSPTHAFASHFVTSTSAFIPASLSSTSSRSLQRPPVPIQTPAVITPALLLLDPQRSFTFFPSGEQAQLAYDALYLGDYNNSAKTLTPRGVFVHLSVQLETKRRSHDHRSLKEGEQQEVLGISWTFLLRGETNVRATSREDDEFPMQIVSHHMIVKDGPAIK